MITTPRLVAITGPLAGAMLALSTEEIALGRDPNNNVCLDDPMVSRRHCLIARTPQGFRLKDCDSSNGTYLNDVPVREQPLEHGDRLKIGESHFLFLAQEVEAGPTTLDSHLDDGRVVTGQFITLRPEEAIYLRPEKITAELPASSRVAGIAAVAFDNLRRTERLEQDAQRLQAEINLEHALIGESAPMLAVYQLLHKVAPSDSTVLLRGESGTGKELAARALHRFSLRINRPFIAINCAGLSDTLLESDLFGHEKGAFTGAVAQKKGKLEVADGGTVFLDEMGELPLALQAKLLRVLQLREFERVGGTRTLKVDIRIVAATNRDLEAAIKDGSFRSDLYYRLNVVSVTMPPLRDRRDDIPLLARYFATRYGQKCKRNIKGVAAATQALLANYDWPGNVRELENSIERAVVLGSTDFIQPEDLPEVLHETAASPTVPAAPYHEAAREAKKQAALRALEESHGNFTQAAKLLGIHPNNLHRIVRHLGLKPYLKKFD